MVVENYESLVWIAIPGYDKYEIAKDDNNDCYIRNRKNKKILKPQTCRGYQFVILHKKTVYVHRLIGLVFLPRDDETKTVIDHKDRNKSNNNISNLEWVSVSANNRNRILKGTHVTALPEKVAKFDFYQARQLHHFDHYYYGDNKVFRQLREGYYEQLEPRTVTTGKYKNKYYSMYDVDKRNTFIPVSVITKMCEQL